MTGPEMAAQSQFKKYVDPQSTIYIVLLHSSQIAHKRHYRVFNEQEGKLEDITCMVSVLANEHWNEKRDTLVRRTRAKRDDAIKLQAALIRGTLWRGKIAAL
jgi:hypothetical protein